MNQKVQNSLNGHNGHIDQFGLYGQNDGKG